MYQQHIILYGNQTSLEKARILLQNQKEIRREYCLHAGTEIRLFLDTPLKETSLIPLLRERGSQGFRLVEIK